MKLIYSNPVTNGSRHQIKIDKSILLKSTRCFKETIKSFQKSNGRSSVTGHITSWHKGGGKKRLYRSIQFNNDPKTAISVGISYDPNRSAFVSTNFDLNKRCFFNTIATKNTRSGSLIKINAENTELKLGFKTPLSKMPVGTIINNISSDDKSISKYARSAGVSAQLVQLDNKHAKIKLSSNTIIKVSNKAYANIGVVSNSYHHLIKIGKAGRNRNLNRRPIVRGIAMNPVDHPHGGRTNGGRPSVTPWGLPTKGKFYLKKRNKKQKEIFK